MIARVKDIKNIDRLNIVEFDFNNITLKMMSLELQKLIFIKGKTFDKTIKCNFQKLYRNDIIYQTKLCKNSCYKNGNFI